MSITKEFQREHILAVIALLCSSPISLHGEEPILLEGHTDHVTSLAFSPDGKELMSGGEDGTVLKWDLATRKPVKVIEVTDGWISQISLAPEGSILVYHCCLQHKPLFERDEIRVFDLKKEQLLWKRIIAGNGGYFALSPDGKVLATPSHERKSNNIMLWDTITGKESGCLKGGGREHRSLAFSPDGKWLASSHMKSEVVIWDLSEQKVAVELVAYPTNCPIGTVSFSPDGKKLAVSAANSSDPAKVFDWRKKQLLHDAQGKGMHEGTLCYSPDGAFLATLDLATSTHLSLQETTAYKRIGGLGSKEEERTRAIAFSPDSKQIATGGKDNVIRIRKVPQRD